MFEITYIKKRWTYWKNVVLGKERRWYLAKITKITKYRITQVKVRQIYLILKWWKRIELFLAFEKEGFMKMFVCWNEIGMFGCLFGRMRASIIYRARYVDMTSYCGTRAGWRRAARGWDVKSSPSWKPPDIRVYGPNGPHGHHYAFIAIETCGTRFHKPDNIKKEVREGIRFLS